MVMPLYDDNSDRQSVPVVNYILLALNILLFVGAQQLGSNVRLTYALALVPEEIVTGRDVVTPDRRKQDPSTGDWVDVPGLQRTPFPTYLTLLTSMFLHGSLLHLVGNMLFLWIFGDNVEDRLGHLRYLIFYLLCGIVAGLAHVASTVALGDNRFTPCIGASGAISGVLGGYVLLFPQRRVMVLIFRVLTEVPAWVAIGLWFLFQLIESLGALGGTGGVAYGAHIGGFLFGLVVIPLFTLGREQTAAPTRRGSRDW